MKWISAIALFTIATLTAATELFAQEPVLKANIPFNFTVGERSMPAGEYTICSPGRQIVMVQSADRRHVELVIASQNHRDPATANKLVFDKYGEFYFLHRVLSTANSSLNLNIPSSKVEKRIRNLEAMLQTEEQTVVAAR